MARTAKTDPREKLLKELAELDNSTEIAKLTAEISELKASNAALVAQRDKAIKRNADLEKILREIHTSLKPITPALETGAPLSRGPVYSPERRSTYTQAAAAFSISDDRRSRCGPFGTQGTYRRIGKDHQGGTGEHFPAAIKGPAGHRPGRNPGSLLRVAPVPPTGEYKRGSVVSLGISRLANSWTFCYPFPRVEC